MVSKLTNDIKYAPYACEQVLFVALHRSSLMPRLGGQSSSLICGIIPVSLPRSCPPREVVSPLLCGVDGSFPTTGPWQ